MTLRPTDDETEALRLRAEEPVVRDFGLLESALARPATTVVGDDAQDAAFDLVMAVADGSLDDIGSIAARLAGLTT